jgi:hypothetical protein
MLRWIGAAVVGAVRVVGAAEKVRLPRLPELKPPPTRASAALASMPTASTTANAAASLRTLNPIMKSSRFLSARPTELPSIPRHISVFRDSF